MQFREQELATKLKVGYAVLMIDMNGDSRLDIVIVDSKRIIWLENPNWNQHTMTSDESQRYDNVCFAPYDIDGDGRLDFAVGADWQFRNTNSGGTIGWISPGKKPDDLWSYHPISTEPTVHRMRFADIDGDGRSELIVAPLKGRNTSSPDFAENGVRLLAYKIPADPKKDRWQATVISDQLHVMHNFWPTRWRKNKGPIDLLTASFEGVHLHNRNQDGSWHQQQIGTGDQMSSPNRGASEIKLGAFAKVGNYIATIEPWHGNQVVVYTKPDQSRAPSESAGNEMLWNRLVLDDQLKWGHAVWCANLDDDADEELIIGVRDDLNAKNANQRRGLRIYDPLDSRGSKWKRYLFDPGSVAIEDLTVGDLNGDGRNDIVAVGRQTHNVKIYWNETK